MSYTRWSTSNWYSFYNSSSENSSKEDQALSLWHVTETKTYTYKELQSMGIGKLQSLYPDATEEDILEAMDIIARFKKDVCDDFNGDDLK
jgi:hypothetical protein